MLIGVISDTHDNLPKVAAATDCFRSEGVEAILHAGDYVAPFAARVLMKAGMPVIGVFGNNDGERGGLLKACETIHESPYRFELGGRTIVLAHDAADLNDKITAGADLVIRGHDHKMRWDPGPPALLNPGEGGGWLTGLATCALVDLDTMRYSAVELGGQETAQP